MGKRSVKENKTVYQRKREDLGYSREEASARMETISPERLERLENGRIPIQPRDVVELSRGYRAPELCSYYCRNDCAVGGQNGRDIRLKTLPQIAVETFAALNQVDAIKTRLLEIVSDGEVTAQEYADFAEIETVLEKLALSVDSLQLWIRNRKANGYLPEEMTR
ncbi:MAG: helix-turn-helix transcriptional regulator [Firmicutes bacterium]|nr:helix-turn-helix transcriptional regulator [Bacillota bacterium]